MCMTLISISKVLEVMRVWMRPYISKWTDDGDHWTFNYDNGEFYWVWASNSTNVVVYIGAKLCHQGKCIKIWTEHDDNTNIMITEDSVVFIQDSDFEHFFRESMYDLFTRLENSNDEAEEVMNNNLEKEAKDTGIKIDGSLPGIVTKSKFDLNFFELYKAYAIYDRANVCRHGILTSADENDLSFCTYGTGALRTDILIDIDEYLDGEYKIIPLIVSELCDLSDHSK